MIAGGNHTLIHACPTWQSPGTMYEDRNVNYYVYILTNKNHNVLYTGITGDLIQDGLIYMNVSQDDTLCREIATDLSVLAMTRKFATLEKPYESCCKKERRCPADLYRD